MARNAPCAKAARQRVSTECVHRRSTFASMRNTDSESDAESDADTESVVVDESADSVVWDAVKPNARREAALKLSTTLKFILYDDDTNILYENTDTKTIIKTINMEMPKIIAIIAKSCKIMEHCIVSNIWSHLNTHSIITSKQHGFRRGMSCETQLIEATYDWTNILNKGKGQIDVILLDFSKAFDVVPHH